MNRRGHFTGLVLVFFGLALRWPLWNAFRFREDEALYGHWAWLIYSGVDVMLARAPVDKPPLFPYLLAWTFSWLTPSEVAARWPNLAASSLTLPLLYAWTRALFGPAVAWRALALYAVLPLAVLMAPTAYTDPLMVGLSTLSLAAAARTGSARPLWAALSGAALGAAVTTKPQALLVLPLVWGTAWARRHFSPLWAAAWALGASIPLARWWQWEALRPGPDTWHLGIAHYGGVGLASAQAWGERTVRWGELLVAASGGWIFLVAAGGLAGWGGYRLRRERRLSRGDGVLVAWLVVVGLVYLGSTLATWDRYLLMLAPAGVCVVARGWAELTLGEGEQFVRLGGIALLLWTGVQAGLARYPVGGDHGAYDGVDALSAHILEVLPRGGVLYHRWLGWHYGFYLFGAPYDYRWWPDETWLAEDAAASRHLTRLIAFPARQEKARQRVLAVLQARGVRPRLLSRVRGRDGRVRFFLYRLEGGRAPP